MGLCPKCPKKATWPTLGFMHMALPISLRAGASTTAPHAVIVNLKEIGRESLDLMVMGERDSRTQDAPLVKIPSIPRICYLPPCHCAGRVPSRLNGDDADMCVLRLQRLLNELSEGWTFASSSSLPFQMPVGPNAPSPSAREISSRFPQG